MYQVKTNIWFVVIILFNIVLKSIYCDYTPFSYDEIISIKDTLLDFGHIKHEAEWDNNPPFYYYCLWVWHKILPISEFNSRFLSVIFVSIGIGFVYRFCAQYLNLFTAFSTAVILSFSNFVIYYAQETRAYSLVFLLSIFSFILFHRYVLRKELKILLLLGLVNFLLIYTHYISGLIVLFQGLTILFFFRKDYFKFTGAQFIIITVLIALRFTKKQFNNILNYDHKEFWLKKAEFGDLISVLLQLYCSRIFLFSIIVIVLLIFYRWIFHNNMDKNDWLKFYFISIGFFSVIFLFVIGVFKPIFLNRYLIFSVPFSIMILCWELSEFQGKLGKFIFAIGTFSFIFNVQFRKESGVNFKDLANCVLKLKQKNDVIIVNKSDNIILFEYYFSKKDFMNYKKWDSIFHKQNLYGLNELSELNALNLQSTPNVFLVQSFHKLNSQINLFEENLSLKYKRKLKIESFKGIELNLFSELNEK